MFLICQLSHTSLPISNFKIVILFLDDDSDRGMRRVSYLKATSNNPMESGAATTPETASPVTEPTKGYVQLN